MEVQRLTHQLQQLLDVPVVILKPAAKSDGTYNVGNGVVNFKVGIKRIPWKTPKERNQLSPSLCGRERRC